MATATAPTTANYTIDPVSGGMTSTGAPGMVDVTGGGASSLGSLAPSANNASTDPYQIFNSNLSSMLVAAQNQNQSNNSLLGGALNTLETESVAPGGAQPANPQVFSNDQVTNQQNLQKGFQPAVTSIATQQANTASAMTGITNTIGALQQSEQPIVLSQGQSLVSRDGTVIQQGHQYTPQMNPITQQMDGFDANTGTWASQDNANSTSTPPTSNASLVGGIDFSGASTGTQPYATDTNYAAEVDSMYSQIKKVNAIPTAAGLDQFIQSQVGGKGSVTGQMIMAAATQYQIDPNMLAAVIAHESDFGTSPVASKANNVAGISYVGQSGASQGPARPPSEGGYYAQYNSVQQGVNAAASTLAKYMPGNSNAGAPTPVTANGTTASNVGGQFSPAAVAQVNQLPPAIQQYVQAGPAGVAYIDDTRVPASQSASIQAIAAKAGIPYLAAGDVGAMQSLVQAQQNLNLMETTAKQELSSGFFGGAKDMLLTGLNDVSGGNIAPNLNKFNGYATEAINLIKGLAGGTGSGLRMTQSEIDTAQANIPSSNDTLTNAMTKVNVLQGLIYTRISSVFPAAQVIMVNPSGQQGYVPAGQYSDAINEGYTLP